MNNLTANHASLQMLIFINDFNSIDIIYDAIEFKSMDQITCSRKMRNITTKTESKQSPMIGKLTKYRNARRLHAGASLGSSLPVTELSSRGP